MNILGLKIEGHDPGAALIYDHEVVAIAEERLNRIKHSQGLFPRLSIDYCLNEADLQPCDLDLIVIDHTSRQSGQNIKDLFYQKTGDRFKEVRLEVVTHHEAHAAAAFLCSPFSESAVMVYDGRGSMLASDLGAAFVETESLFRGHKNTLTFIDRTLHPAVAVRWVPKEIGIGMLYDRMTHQYVSFGRHDAGKLMGLAAYGDDSLLRQHPLSHWVTWHDGRLICNGDWKFVGGSADKRVRNMKVRLVEVRNHLVYFLRKLILVLVKSKKEACLFPTIEFEKPARDPNKDQLPDKHYAAAAFAAQAIFEHFAVSLAIRLQKITQSRHLCVSGGCALNIDANRSFLTKANYNDIFVQPASSDCGIALGCALYGKHITLDQPRDWVMTSAALGRQYNQEDINVALQKYNKSISYRHSADIAKETAHMIADGKIVGWFQGKSEYGPRALGQRSILCDASNKKMRDVLNARVKHREMWRPFAASILAERLGDWFDLKPNSATGFMLLAAEVFKHKRDLVPAIIHVDGTCRMQTVTEKDNGLYYKLIEEFETLTGIPLILNTSFNLGGEPIVETPVDAIDTFLRTDFDALVIHDSILTKK